MLITAGPKENILRKGRIMTRSPRERANQIIEGLKIYDDFKFLPPDLSDRIAFQINEAVLEEREANFKFVAAAARNERPVEKHYDKVDCVACKTTGRFIILPTLELKGGEGREEFLKYTQGICLACNGRGHQRELRCSK